MTEDDKYHIDRQAEFTMVILLATHEGDNVGASLALASLANTYGWRGLLSAVVGWASMVQDAAGFDLSGDQFVGLQAVNVDTGEEVSIDRTGAPPELVTAIRIFASWINGDRELVYDLFMTAVEGGYGQEVVASALVLAAAQLGPELDRRLKMDAAEDSKS